MTGATDTKVQSNLAMHNLYYASKKTEIGSKTVSFEQVIKTEDMVEARTSSTTVSYSNSNAIYEQMGYNSKAIVTNQDNKLSNEDTLKPVFITFNSGLTGYDTVEYFYDSSSGEDNPAMYMKTKSGKEENYYKLDLNSIDLSTATKAELLGYYSYQEFKGEKVDMYQLMADMDMAEHNGNVSAGDNLHDTFLKYKTNWLKALQDVLNIQKNSGDSKGATATDQLLHLMNSARHTF